LAERAGLSIRAVRDIEAGGNHQPRRDTVDRLLAALDVPVGEQADFREAAGRLEPAYAAARDGGDTSTAGAAKVLTILIADLRGYTAYTVEHGDEAGARLAERFAASTRAMVERYEGTLQELRGDEALCVFSSSRQALRAALALQERYREDKTDGGLPLGAGIGLDAGEAVPVGDGYRGTALNLAARLCALAGPGEVLASEAVAHLARALDGVRYDERGAVNLNGLGEPVRVIEILRDEPSPTREDTGNKDQPLPIGGFLGALPANPLAGRQDEVERIEAALDRVVDGGGQLLVLSGGPGFGKTRLAQEATVLARNRGFLLATGRCYASEQDARYTPFLEALSMAFAGAPPSTRREVATRWPHLGRLLPEDTVTVPAGNPPDERQRLFRAASGFLSGCAVERPVALLLDDMHWADEESLALLAHVVRATRGARVLVLVTYRDNAVDRQHPLDRTLRELSREGLVERIPVHRLSPDGTAAMVEATIGETEASEEFAAFVHRRTRGTPYFIEEMLQALGGRYRLVREIGAGGMGRVFQAVDTRTGTTVAAKLMFASGEADLDALLRFQQEGAVLATLKHPNIVEVYTTFTEEHASCIVMELLDGRSVGELLRAGELSLPRIKTITQQAASALAFAHGKAIVHRDVKPDNIMVLAGDQVKVTDFGIARILRPAATVSTMQSTGMSLGTPL
jgi:class 3 adenylate cyclase